MGRREHSLRSRCGLTPVERSTVCESLTAYVVGRKAHVRPFPVQPVDEAVLDDEKRWRTSECAHPHRHDRALQLLGQAQFVVADARPLVPGLAAHRMGAQQRDDHLGLRYRFLQRQGEVFVVAAQVFAVDPDLIPVFTFLVLYLHFVVGLPETRATQLMSTLTGVGAVLAIAASLVTARMIARVGVVRVVRQSSWVMALAAAGYAGAAFAPQLWLVVPLLLVFGLANGVFGAADWALALAVLPTGQDAGKDMGIWHVCLVLPQIIGPITTGVLITAVEHAASARAAYALAFAVAAAWFLAASI